MANAKRRKDFDYDVSLSFAGEDREFVEQVASSLIDLGVRVFYDKYEEIDLWGKDLYVHLSDLYRMGARYCVMFISKNYAQKLWTNHERKSAQERAFKENKEYILPARFDSTPIPGLLETVGYISLSRRKPVDFAVTIASKVIELPRHNYFPLNADNLEVTLRKELRLRSPKSIRLYLDCGFRLYQMLTRLTQEERKLIFSIVVYGCVEELPGNLHIDLEMLRRVSGFTSTRIERIARKVSPLGFHLNLGTEHHGSPVSVTGPMLALDWKDLNLSEPPHPTTFLYWMILSATYGYCQECGFKALLRLDFSQLSSKTSITDPHLQIDNQIALS